MKTWTRAVIGLWALSEPGCTPDRPATGSRPRQAAPVAPEAKDPAPPAPAAPQRPPPAPVEPPAVDDLVERINEQLETGRGYMFDELCAPEKASAKRGEEGVLRVHATSSYDPAECALNVADALYRNLEALDALALDVSGEIDDGTPYAVTLSLTRAQFEPLDAVQVLYRIGEGMHQIHEMHPIKVRTRKAKPLCRDWRALVGKLEGHASFTGGPRWWLRSFSLGPGRSACPVD